MKKGYKNTGIGVIPDGWDVKSLRGVCDVSDNLRVSLNSKQRKKKIFAILRDHLCPGGSVVIWEPNWPSKYEDLRMPDRRALAFQNLSEHVLGNHFLHSDEIVAELKAVGLKPEVFSVAGGRDVVVTGMRIK